MRTNLRPAVTRRSFVSLAFLSPSRPAPRQPQARMTSMGAGWDWLFRWCGLAPASGLPAAV